MDSQYFATLEPEDLGKELIKRVDDYYDYISSKEYLTLWKKSYQQYYKGHFTAGQVKDTGKQGELKKLSINHYRNLLRHLAVFTTSQRPSFEPRAINTDYKSMSQVILADGLLDFYMRKKRVERYVIEAVDYALMWGEGWFLPEWDESLGEPIRKENDDDLKEEIENVIEDNDDTEKDDPILPPPPKTTGDMTFEVFGPVDVIRDTGRHDIESNEWFIVRRWINKFELAAKYPEWADKIIYEGEKEDKSCRNTMIQDFDYDEHEELIAMYTFLHKKTAAVPNGRMSMFLNGDIVFYDSDLPYSNFPLSFIIPDRQKDSPFGYTVGFDLLAIQQVIDSLYSTIVTNQNAFGVQNIAVPAAANLTAKDLGGGLKILEYNSAAGEPRPMQLLSTPAEIFNFVNGLEHIAETLSGVNSVSRGNPEASLKSGASLALVQSMAIQFSSGLQHSYAQLLEDAGTNIITILRDYASAPRVAIIAGKSKRSYMKEFRGDDLKNIDRVIVDMGNPLARTTAGRVNLADTLLQNGLIKTPEEYFQVLNSGQIDPMIEGETAELQNIRSENEQISEGAQVQATVIDNHMLHIKEHKIVLASPESRNTPEIIKNALTHIQQHINALRVTDPGLLQILGQVPIGAPAPGPAPAPAPGPAPGGGGQSPQPGTAMPPPQPPTLIQSQAKLSPMAETMNTQPEIMEQLPNMPKMPKNPLSGNEFDTETGGLQNG